jgi:hypothetical protein
VAVDVVADLLGLVAEDAVRNALDNGAHQVREESMKLGPRVIRPGEAAAAQADRLHPEISSVLLHEHIRWLSQSNNFLTN